jgi:hypothetical protein
MIQNLFRCLLLALAVVTAGGEAWAKNWNLSEGQESKDFNKIDLSTYDEFRTLSFIIDGQTYDSHAAYRQGKNLFGFYAKGILFYEGEVCDWDSNITNRTTKTGSFEVRCPSGFSVDGRYTYVGNRQGSYGSGTDSKGRAVSYKLGAEGSSNRALIANFQVNAQSGLFNQPSPELALDNRALCNLATVPSGKGLNWSSYYTQHVNEAKRRGLSCGVGDTGLPTQSADIQLSCTPEQKQSSKDLYCGYDNRTLCSMLSYSSGKFNKSLTMAAVNRGLKCAISELSNVKLCAFANNFAVIRTTTLLDELAVRGLNCGVGGKSPSTQTALDSVPQAKPQVTLAELTAAEKEADRLRKELAALKAQQEQRQQTISSDNQKPVIQITSSSSNGPQGTVRGRVTDNTGVAEVRVDGQLVRVDGSGNFSKSTFVPVGGVAITVQATDLAGLSSSMSVRLERAATASSATLSFARLNPLVRKVAKNADALALIIGVDSYENTPARAIYADKDAQVFADYATEKLGIPANRIKTLVNNGAGERELLLSVRSWLSRASKQGKTDVYVFFAGHGLASDDGQKMYLLPYDGAPELLDKTAILRDELFADISAANPRSVTVFLDTCYSGTTRGTDMLIASRPIAIKALKQLVPDNFTVMTAARGDQTAKPLEEAKHGMFSYFLMKGMEGEADQNKDNKITAGELYEYVERNVVQQSSGSQTPELQGDADRVLVRFQ